MKVEIDLPEIEGYEKLSRVTTYNRKTRLIHWTENVSPVARDGQQAGCLDHRGYRIIRYHGKNYYQHRFAYWLLHGEIAEYVDHIDGNPSNNKPCNLRNSTNSQNQMNGSKALGRSGIKGVSWVESSQKWRVGLKVNKQFINLGLHEDLEFAEILIQEAREKYHGEYGRHVNNGRKILRRV